MIGLILDIVIILIIGLFIFLGYRRGLVKVAISLIAFIVAIIITLVLYKPVSTLIIEKTQIDENISDTIYKNIGIKNLEQEEEFVAYLREFTESSEILNLGDSVNMISVKIIEIACMIVIYLIARVILIALSLLSGIITNLPIIKQFNELGGALYGIFQGVFIVYTILAVIFILASTSVSTEVLNAINSSHICKFMYMNNLILKVIL